jgi:predicted nucleic acid-binding protein
VTFLLDANVFVYSATEGDGRDACLAILDAVARGEADGRTSTAVLEEVWLVERSGRAGNLEGLTERAYTVMTPLLAVTDDAFRRALSLGPSRLGTNDRLHIGTCMAHGIDTIVSADRDFDAVAGLRRVDPLDGRARSGLLGARG